MLIDDSEVEMGFSTAKNLVSRTEKPKFWSETVPAYFSENDLLFNFGRDIWRENKIQSSYLTPPEEDFKPLNEEVVQGIPVKYWDYLAEATNKTDLEVRRNKIIRELKDLDIRQRSSGWAYFGAGLLEMLVDPITYLPIPKIRRYANILEGIGKNIAHVAPSIFVPTAAANAATISMKETKGLEDWALETFTQGVIGSALVGIPGAFGAGEFLRAKLGMKALHSDLDLKAVVAEKNTKAHKRGEIIGYKAVPSEDSGVTIGELKEKTIVPINETKITNQHTSPEIKASSTGETLTPSQAERLKKSVDEAVQLEGMTPTEITLLKAKEMQKLIDDGISVLGEKAMFKFLYKPSPIIKGLTSSFSIFRRFTNSLFDHNLLLGKMEHPKLKEINTKIEAAKKLIKEAKNPEEKIKFKEELNKIKEEKRNLKPEEFETTYEGTPQQEFAAQVEAAKYMNKKAWCDVQSKEIWKESIGLGGTLTSKVPMAETTFDVLKKIGAKEGEGQISFKQTMEDATFALRRGEQSNNTVAQKIAQFYREHLYDPLLKDLKELGLLPENLTTNEAVSYVNRLYNKDIIRAKYDEFMAVLERFYIARDRKIKEIYAPIKTAQNNVDKITNSIKKLKNPEEQLRKQLELQLEKETRHLKNLQDTLQHQIDTGTIPLSQLDLDNGITQLSLVDGKPTFTKALKEEYESLTKNLNSMQENLETAKKSNAPKEEIKKLKESLEKEKQAIKEKMEKGEVSKELFYTGKKTGRKRLINIQKKTLASLALQVKDYAHLAKCIADTILDENSQQMAARVFDGMRGKGKGRPSALKSRTVLCADHIIEKFLINDLTEVAGAHAGHLSNYIALEKFYRKFGTDREHAKEFFVSKLKEDFDQAKDVILRGKDTPVREKKLKALQKDFKEAKSGMEEFLDVFRGDYERPKTESAEGIQSIIDNLKSYAYSTMMGGVALMFQTDIVMPMFKHGFRHIVDGVLPVLGQMVDMKIPKHVWADSAVGINTALATLRKSIWGQGSQFWSTSPRSGINRLFENMSKTGSNLFFINQLWDVAENMAASTSASSLIRDLEKWASKGHMLEVVDQATGKKKQKWISEYKFSKKELERLELGRFDLQEHGLAVLDMFGKYGDKQYGGFIPNTTAWGNTKAADHFRMFIRREVDHLINKPKMGDSPFWFKHPALSLTTQFLSWSMGVTNNITIPMMQRLDQEKLTWMVFAMGLGSLTGPMRQLANGQEIIWDKRTLLTEGIMQSGILGWHADQIIKLNSVLDIEAFRPFQSDRFRRKSLADLALGPVGNILDNAGKISSMFLNGELNKQDFRKTIRLAPYANCFYLRQLLNDWVESTSLPKKAPKRHYGEEAESWW